MNNVQWKLQRSKFSQYKIDRDPRAGNIGVSIVWIAGPEAKSTSEFYIPLLSFFDHADPEIQERARGVNQII